MRLKKYYLSAAVLCFAAASLSPSFSAAQTYSDQTLRNNDTTDFPRPAGPQNEPPPSTAIPGQYVSPAGNYSYNGNKAQTQAPSAQAYQGASNDQSYLTQRYRAPTMAAPSSGAAVYSLGTQSNAAAPVQSSPNSTTYTSGPIYKTANSSDYSQLPTYKYDPRLDPRQNPVPKAPVPPVDEEALRHRHDHPYWDLETHSGFDVTGQFAYYGYNESSLGVNDKGPIFGLEIEGTYNYRSWFGQLDGRYGYASTDYSSSSGEADSEPTDTLEFRALVGHDVISDSYSMSPYIGVGYRTLENDARGTTNLGSNGYRRYNQLYYIPIGVYPRTHIDTSTRLTSMFEYDYVVHGLQKSDLADAGGGDPNLHNVQDSGFALRGNIMVETKSGWSFGPYFIYWNISQSKTKTFLDNSSSTCNGAPPCIVNGDEPANDTIEAGVQLRYHFF